VAVWEEAVWEEAVWEEAVWEEAVWEEAVWEEAVWEEAVVCLLIGGARGMRKSLAAVLLECQPAELGWNVSTGF
jgi:hypothetical protein